MKRFLITAVAAVSIAGIAATSMASDGASIYKSKCAMCHGATGAGSPMGNAINGNEFISGGSDAEIADAIVKGRRGAAKKYPQYAMGMPAQRLGDDDLKAVVEYIQSLASK